MFALLDQLFLKFDLDDGRSGHFPDQFSIAFVFLLIIFPAVVNCAVFLLVIELLFFVVAAVSKNEVGEFLSILSDFGSLALMAIDLVVGSFDWAYGLGCWVRG